MQYYGALDLENMSDDCCYRAEGSAEVIFVKKPDWNNMKQLRVAGQIYKTAEDGQKQQEKKKLLKTYLGAVIRELSSDILHRFGSGTEDPLPLLCMTLLIPCEAGESFREEIREFLVSQNVGRVQFLAKEAAAALYDFSETETEQAGGLLFLYIDAGESRCSSSLFRIKDGDPEILERAVQEGAGASALDQACLKYLKSLLGNGFASFHTKGEAFQRLLLNWVNGRTGMCGEIELRMDDFWKYAECQLPLEERQCIDRLLSGSYSKKLILSKAEIQYFSSEAFEMVRKQVSTMLAEAEVNWKEAGQIRMVLNGSYLNMPFFQEMLMEWLEMRKVRQIFDLESIVMCRSACLQGALSKPEWKDRLFGTVVPRTLGLLLEGEGEEPAFCRMLPGGKKLSWGYEKTVFLTSLSPEKDVVKIELFSLPSSWQEKDGLEELSLETSISISSPKTRFPNRKLRVSVRMDHVPEVEVYDLTSGNRETVRLAGTWMPQGDVLADCQHIHFCSK